MTNSSSTVSIKLGDASYELRPLTLGQIERLAEVTDDQSLRGSGKLGVQSARRILSIGLEKIAPTAAANNCEDLTGKVGELFVASRKILVLSGLTEEPAAPGELPAPVVVALASEPAAPLASEQSAPVSPQPADGPQA